MPKISKYINYILILLFVMLIPIISCSTDVDASRQDVDSITYIAENQTSISAICSKANKEVGKQILVYTGNDGLLSFSNELYSELTVDEKRDFMEVALLTTKESGLNSKLKNKVYNFIAEQDTTSSAAVKYLRSNASADFVKASSWFKPFSGFIGTALGVLSLLIFLFVGLSVVLDIAYMSLPGFRVILNREDRKRPRWVSREAYSAVVDSESSIGEGGYKGHMGLYLQRRIPSLVLMCIALGYLISGQIYDTIAYIIDSFSWIFN